MGISETLEVILREWARGGGKYRLELEFPAKVVNLSIFVPLPGFNMAQVPFYVSCKTGPQPIEPVRGVFLVGGDQLQAIKHAPTLLESIFRKFAARLNWEWDWDTTVEPVIGCA